MQNPQWTNIIVGKHAQDRFKERFGAQFLRLRRQFSIPSIIMGQLNGAVECNKWKASPFHRNMLNSRYGINLIALKRGPVYYVCGIEGQTLFVRTVVKKWYYE